MMGQTAAPKRRPGLEASTITTSSATAWRYRVAAPPHLNTTSLNHAKFFPLGRAFQLAWVFEANQVFTCF
jgi:hypothetical protein